MDPFRVGNCDPTSGECHQCLYNTEGFHCEFCKSGFYGDALQQSCRGMLNYVLKLLRAKICLMKETLCSECVCDILGTDQKRGPCDKFSGQCPCLPNVTGLRCDGCEKNHWKIASGIGCEHCNCDPIGSESEQCNQVRNKIKFNITYRDGKNKLDFQSIIINFSPKIRDSNQ